MVTRPEGEDEGGIWNPGISAVSEGVSGLFDAFLQNSNVAYRVCNANMDGRDIVCVMPTGLLCGSLSESCSFIGP